jgi:hypothetical protein
MNFKKWSRFLLTGCLFAVSLQAQESGTPLPLQQILNNISKTHDVNFNYIDEEIAFFKLIAPNENLSLSEKLNYISKKTHLKFEFITPKHISIVNDKRLDKPLCGYLIDKDSQEPIAFATLRNQENNSYATSDENGYFTFSEKNIFTIEVEHVGYENLTFSSSVLYSEICPKIAIKQHITILENFVAEIYLAKGITKTTNGLFEISPKKIGLLPGLTEPDVFQTLQQMPGFLSSDENIANTSVRGGTHDQNLYRWNGIKLFHTAHFFGLISTLNPNLTHKVSVMKNGTPAKYGDGVSSTVLISTHADSIEKPSAAIGVNLINVDFYSKFKISKKANIEISGRRSYTDFATSPTYSSYYNKIFQNTIVTNYSNSEDIKYNTTEDFYFYDFSAQYHQQIKNKTHLYVDLIGISNVLDVYQNKTENNLTINKNSCLEQQTLGASALLKSEWNKNNILTFTAAVSYYSINSENESLENNQIFNQKNTVLDTETSITNATHITKSSILEYGYQFNEKGIQNIDEVNSPVISRKTKEVLRSHALFSDFKYLSKNGKINSRIGIRQTYIEEFSKWILEPRFHFNYKLIPSVNIEIQAEKKHQTYSQIIDLQQDFLGIEKRRWVLSDNENIPIIKSNQIALGFTFSKKNWLLTLDNYYKIVEGISSQSQGFQNQLEFVKINGKYNVLGSELLIQKQWKNWTAWTSYTFMNNKYDFPNWNPSTFPNNFEISHTFKSAIITEINKIKLSLGSIWFTGKPNTTIYNNEPVYNIPGTPSVGYNNPNNSNLEDYFQLNFSTAYTIKTGKKSKLNFGFSLLNLFNNNKTINQQYRINYISNKVEQVNTYSLERTFNAFLRYTL